MVRRESVSHKCDVYSFGILAWEIVTQKVPFSDVKSYELPFRIAEGEVGITEASTSELNCMHPLMHPDTNWWQNQTFHCEH